MSAVLQAMSVSGAILLGVVVVVVLISIAAVKRGAKAMEEDSKH